MATEGRRPTPARPNRRRWCRRRWPGTSRRSGWTRRWTGPAAGASGACARSRPGTPRHSAGRRPRGGRVVLAGYAQAHVTRLMGVGTRVTLEALVKPQDANDHPSAPHLLRCRAPGDLVLWGLRVLQLSADPAGGRPRHVHARPGPVARRARPRRAAGRRVVPGSRSIPTASTAHRQPKSTVSTPCRRTLSQFSAAFQHPPN